MVSMQRLCARCLQTTSNAISGTRSIATRSVHDRAGGRRHPNRREQRQQQQQLKPSYPLSYLVTCHPGLQEVTAAELQQPFMLAEDVQVVAPGRVTFSAASAAAGYAAALCLRSATRVLQLIHQEQLDPDRAAGDTVYEATRAAAAWQELLGPGQTLGVHCLHFFNNSNVNNSQLVGRRVRDAVCDAVRDARGVRPAPPDGPPDLPLVFQMLSDRLQLFRDLGGGSLHRRGYRSAAAVHKAALNEAAAAGLLLLTDWQNLAQQPGAVLADPMCGSGTFLIEAALIATNTAPGLLHSAAGSSSGSSSKQQEPAWPFQGWHDCYEPQQWQQVLAAAQQRAEAGQQQWRQLGGRRLLGNDVHDGALRLAQQAASAAGVSDLVRLRSGPCSDWQPAATPRLVVTNPPWGLRLLGDQPPSEQQAAAARRHGRAQGRGSSSSSMGRGQYYQQQQQAGGLQEEDPELAGAWLQLSEFLKQRCAGADAWVLSGNPGLTGHLGMRSCRKRSVSIGGLKTAWLKYEVRQQQQQQQQEEEKEEA